MLNAHDDAATRCYGTGEESGRGVGGGTCVCVCDDDVATMRKVSVCVV